MKTILLALLWFSKTMKGGKKGSGKYYYFWLPNNRGIWVGAHSIRQHVESKDDRK